MQVLVVVVLLGAYGFGAWKFWSGFGRTNFEKSASNRIRLSLLWPALILANKSYRRNFQKALKG